MPKKKTVVLLRWVLIIAFSYLLILDATTHTARAPLTILIALALASNLAIGRMPDTWVATRAFDFAIVLFDSTWVTLGLAWAPRASGDLFLLYFLVIFVAAMGESLRTIVGSAVLVSVVYAYMLSLQHGADFALTAGALLRVPFLFVVALFYGYFVTEIRGRRHDAMEAHLRAQATTELLAAVSHDLRGPLGNAENLLALILDNHTAGHADERKLLLQTQVNVRRVGALVTNLLDAACIEARQVHLQWAPMQVNDVVEDVFGLEAGAAQLNGVTLTKDLDANLPALTADYVQVGRILDNLVNNAIKYTPRGGSVSIRTSGDGATVSVAVRDSGRGMSQEQCTRLFAPYHRVHLGGYTEGKGLGLYIVKRLTEALGGTVAVSSQPDIGSTFTITLPRVPHEPGGATKRAAARPNATVATVQPVLTFGVPDKLTV